MLDVLFKTPVGLMSILTVTGTMVVVSFWLYFIFKKHDN
ncbi:probable potassium transport system protein kup [Novimethylophilus kurashikiensis]|uniref:Probable potassium transport system protein kup n=1 Tax=Novimethylophilus kurashikiensis TaxID=1825523 RepID=A0A2R5F552_9PROT|nr:DUF3149 domain-containing protein [Novimethylophilus kurashikiensis]GBG13477.1 probable potassium transport system protein kup [Novimethylophilus kurashikiensis]